MAIELTPLQKELLRRAPERLKRLYANGSAKEKKTFLEAIEQRFRDLENKAKKASSRSLSKPKPEAPPKPKPNKPPRASDNARKVKGKVIEPDPKKPKGGPNKPPKGGPNKPPKGSNRVLGKAAKQILKKVAAPLEFVDVAQLALSEDARKQAEADYASMEEDHIISRGFKSFFNPIDTIYSAGSAIIDTSKYTPTYKHDPLKAAARREEYERELEKRYAAMSPEEQAVYDEKRNTAKENKRAKLIKKIMENRALAQKRIENGVTESVQRARGRTPIRYGFRDETGRLGHYSDGGYLRMTEKIARAQKDPVAEAAAAAAAAEAAAAEAAAAEAAAADRAARAEAAAVARAAAEAEEKAAAAASVKDYIKKLDQEAAARKKSLSRPLPTLATHPEMDSVHFRPKIGSRGAKISKAKRDTSTKGAGKAEVISEDPDDYGDKAIELFYNTHHTPFNPKSPLDQGKLKKMKSLLADMGGMGGMTDNQFALQFYRNS